MYILGIYIFVYIKHINSNRHRTIFFIFLFCNTLTAKLDGKAFFKNIIAIYFQLKRFSNFQFPFLHSFYKTNDFVTIHYATGISIIHFDKDKHDKQEFVSRKLFGRELQEVLFNSILLTFIISTKKTKQLKNEIKENT